FIKDGVDAFVVREGRGIEERLTHKRRLPGYFLLRGRLRAGEMDRKHGGLGAWKGRGSGVEGLGAWGQGVRTPRARVTVAVSGMASLTSPCVREPLSMTGTTIRGGVVHDLPADLEAMLVAEPAALATWEDITTRS